MPDPLPPDAYGQTAGTVCPACRSTQVAPGGLTSVSTHAVTRRLACARCGATWRGVYTLTSYDGLITMDEEEERDA